MYYYCQYLTGSLRGVKKIVTDADFKHPLQVFTPEEVKKNLKYKVLGDDKQYWHAGILFVAETLAGLHELINNERPRFNSRYLQSDSSSSDINNDAAGPSKTEISRQAARSTKIQQQILQKQVEVRAQRHASPFKTPLPNAKHVGKIETQKQSIPKKRPTITQKNVLSAENDVYQRSITTMQGGSIKPRAISKKLETVPPSKQILQSYVIPITPESVKTNLRDQDNIIPSRPNNAVPVLTVTADKNHLPQKQRSLLSSPKDPKMLSPKFKHPGHFKEKVVKNTKLPLIPDKGNVQVNLACEDIIPSGTSIIELEHTGDSILLNDNYKRNELQALAFAEEDNSSRKSVNCKDPTCQLQIYRSEETISNLTELLDQQLKTVEELQFEIRHLRETKDELHLKLDNQYDEFQARICDNNNTASSSPYPPSGFMRSSDKHIHLGRDVWLPQIKYNEACNVNSPSLFVKILCDMLFTYEELKESTVTGTDSNRKRGLSRVPKKLDPSKVLAIKDVTKYWLQTLNYSEEAVDIQVSKVKGYISSKIAESQRDKNKKRASKRLKRMDKNENTTDSTESTESTTLSNNKDSLADRSDPNSTDGDTDTMDNGSGDDEAAPQTEQDFPDSNENDTFMWDDDISNLTVIQPEALEWEQLKKIMEEDEEDLMDEQ